MNVDAQTQLRQLIDAEHYGACGRHLAWSQQLRDAARFKAQDMGYRDYFDHRTPEGTRTVTFLATAGVPHSGGWGEIIAWNTYPLDETVLVAWRGWLGSPAHLGVIRWCAMTRFGVGTFRAKDRKLYVAEFTRP